MKTSEKWTIGLMLFFASLFFFMPAAKAIAIFIGFLVVGAFIAMNVWMFCPGLRGK